MTLSNNGKGSLAKFIVVRPESRADICKPKCKTESHVIHPEGLGWGQVISVLISSAGPTHAGDEWQSSHLESRGEKQLLEAHPQGALERE